MKKKTNDLKKKKKNDVFDLDSVKRDDQFLKIVLVVIRQSSRGVNKG